MLLFFLVTTIRMEEEKEVLSTQKIRRKRTIDEQMSIRNLQNTLRNQQRGVEIFTNDLLLPTNGLSYHQTEVQTPL